MELERNRKRVWMPVEVSGVVIPAIEDEYITDEFIHRESAQPFPKQSPCIEHRKANRHSYTPDMPTNNARW